MFNRVCSYMLFYLLYPFLLFVPINKNKIVVSNFWGKGYGDNPKYICNYLLTEKKDIEIVWICNEEILKKNHHKFPKEIRLVQNRTFQALFELYTANIWIDNCRKSFNPPKRKNQFYLQTWHAGFGLKKIENDASNKLTSRYIKVAKKDSKMCDLLVFEHSCVFPDVKKTFWYDGELYRNGIPKNDIIISGNERIVEKVYNYYRINKEKKIVLYAPTFRVDYDLKVSVNLLSKIIRELTDRFNDQYILLLRLHPNDLNLREYIFNNLTISEDIIDSCNYDDMQELLCACDVLITDYSSTFGEMLVADKKCFIYAYDYHEYMKDQGLIMELTELPFPIAFNEAELLLNIRNFNEQEYIERLKVFKKTFNVYESGHASKDIGDRLINYMIK